MRIDFGGMFGVLVAYLMFIFVLLFVNAVTAGKFLFQLVEAWSVLSSSYKTIAMTSGTIMLLLPIILFGIDFNDNKVI